VAMACTTRSAVRVVSHSFPKTETGAILITLSGIVAFRVLKEITGFTPLVGRCEVSFSGSSVILERG